MPSYLNEVSTRTTPQSEPIAGAGQIENSAGGYTWPVGDLMRVRRFLILGSEGGSYYASESNLTRENADAVMKMAREDGIRLVDEIVSVSQAGRAPKNSPALFALAIAMGLGDEETRLYARQSLPKVARIGTHLFEFLGYAKAFRGWGPSLRKGAASWYEDKQVDRLAYQVVKYRMREGWTHRDVLRKAHPKGATAEHKTLYDWITHGATEGELPEIVEGYMKAQAATTPQETADLIREYKLPREALLTEHLTSQEVWQALLDADMPITALIRNLATMTRVGLLSTGSDATKTILEKLGDRERLQKGRVHPIQVLSAMLTYASGQGMRGRHTWEPVVSVIDALDETFYLTWENVEPTNQRLLLALDVSGSMNSGVVAGVPGLTPRVASSAMALVTMAAEARGSGSVEVVGFFTGDASQRNYYGWRNLGWEDGITTLPISPRQRLDDVCTMTDRLPFGGTDCALPALYAAGKNKEFDAILTLTDSETWANEEMHPSQALQAYREKSGIPTKQIVVGMTSNNFSIADPADALQMDVVGFDSSAPTLMADFISGSLLGEPGGTEA